MAATKLSSKAVGSIVKIKINGTLRDFIVVQQGKAVQPLRRFLRRHLALDEGPLRNQGMAQQQRQ